jgi:tRNA uridine 5-carboxymethylaminomethyl modification enzyme
VKEAFQVLVIGGGHAGVEAAVAAAQLGCRTVLVTPSKKTISLMSCNPAIGGIAKGTLVREIDGMGGVAAETADKTALQFRMLNMKKGPAVWGPRVQSDIKDYTEEQVKRVMQAGAIVQEGMVVRLTGPTKRIRGVILGNGKEIVADAFVLATGTFLNGMLHRGEMTWPGGRRGDISAVSLERDIRERMFHVKRFKTGTSPRILRKSVNTDILQKQISHDLSFRFSWSSDQGVRNRELCWVARTTGETEEIVRNSLKKSPLYTGRVNGKGPRYCPSFEDKVTKFPDRTGHPIHIEPVGKESRILYLNGLSTSMPEEIQEKTVRSLPGFRDAIITSYGYTVEYTCFETGEYDQTLKLRQTENVFVCGQILGTSGYEEAAATGLYAGAGAARSALGMQGIVPNRMSSYLGVMVDDLVSTGTDEPYRLFSSRSENRLSLRQDNADRRVFDFACTLGTISEEKKKQYKKRDAEYKRIRKMLKEVKIEGRSVESLCLRPEVSPREAGTLIGLVPSTIETSELLTTAVLDLKYAGYIKRAKTRHRARNRYGEVSLKSIHNYNEVKTITIEAREALNIRRPMTLSAAKAIPAVREADLDALVMYLMKKSVSRET